jgi:hypothetical protein
MGEGFVFLATQTNPWTQGFPGCEGPFVVPAFPLWTDTGLTVRSNQTLLFPATGSWTGGLGDFGPEGDPASPASGDLSLTNTAASQFSLIAFVEPNPYCDTNGANRWLDPAYFPRGTNQGSDFLIPSHPPSVRRLWRETNVHGKTADISPPSCAPLLRARAGGPG